MREFRFDGLRLDAVHAIVDEGPKHILRELAETVRLRAGPDRLVHLVVENDLNQPDLLERDADGQAIWFNAQWNDDFHHCLHAAATSEVFGYYAAYKKVVPLTARALAEGFAYQGEISPFSNEPRGAISAYLPPTSFVSFIQNHDQIGNRAFGERITDITGNAEVRAITAIYLLVPEIPLLFMGEEWRSRQPFPYFCGFEGELADSIRKGRREEFKDLPRTGRTGIAREDPPIPRWKKPSSPRSWTGHHVKQVSTPSGWIGTRDSWQREKAHRAEPGWRSGRSRWLRGAGQQRAGCILAIRQRHEAVAGRQFLQPFSTVRKRNPDGKRDMAGGNHRTRWHHVAIGQCCGGWSERPLTGSVSGANWMRS